MNTARPGGTTGAPAPLHIGGLERLSLVDWPGELAAVVFCQGCPWACHYCHNPHLIPFGQGEGPEWPEVLGWLERRRGLLDAVVFSGGEATVQPALLPAVQAVRALGFKTGLHTGGPHPGRLAALLPWLDWVGFDFKAPFDAYAPVTQTHHGHRARESMRLLLASGTPYEIRTTWHPALLPEAALHTMARTLREAGCSRWVLQRFRADGCASERLRNLPVGEPPLEALRAEAGLEIIVR